MAVQKRYIDQKVLVSGQQSMTGLSKPLDLQDYIQEVVQTPATDDTYDLGSSSKAYQDAYFDGVVYTDNITEHTADTGVTIDGILVKDGAINAKQQVTDTGGAFATPIVLTAAQSGRVILVDDAAGLDFTLPAIGASDIGMVFDFLVTVSVTSNSFRITAATGDLLNGGVLAVDFDAAYTAPQAAFYEPDFSDDLVMTCNGTTTGGKKGTRIKFEAVTATQWFVTGTLVGDGVLATPFS